MSNQSPANIVDLRWNPKDAMGWAPIAHMIGLLAHYIGQPPSEVGWRDPSRLKRFMWSHILKSKRGQEGIALHMLYQPGLMAGLLNDPGFRKPVRKRVVWIVDSFHTDEVMQGLLRHFDHIVIMQGYERPFYERFLPGRVSVLPWGCDALGLGSAERGRPYDLLRVGRQPPEWENDETTAQSLLEGGLSFHGRPPDVGYKGLQEYYRRAKYVLAFSNQAAPSSYTHRSKEYYTGRWTDALASGAVVAGIPPRSDRGVEDLLWDEALLDLGSISREEGLNRLKEAWADWRYETAQINYRNALARLDWRWRFKKLFDELELHSPCLEEDLNYIRTVISQKL
ncbi:hypothetical protein [Thioclava kandeliae]|uniref:Glycosyltransferase family 1 protein n=1 Tax=Thioclava kandeliae TaxID=3070818 RepID=A0ABV1SLJ7_9RHOB